MLQKNNINFLHTSSEEEKNIPTCQFKGTSLLKSLSAVRMTVLLCYLTSLPQTAAKKCISFQRKASSFKDDECGGISQSEAYSKHRKWQKSVNLYQLAKLSDGKQKDISLHPNLTVMEITSMGKWLLFSFSSFHHPQHSQQQKAFTSLSQRNPNATTCPRFITLACHCKMLISITMLYQLNQQINS